MAMAIIPLLYGKELRSYERGRAMINGTKHIRVSKQHYLENALNVLYAISS